VVSPVLRLPTPLWHENRSTTRLPYPDGNVCLWRCILSAVTHLQRRFVHSASVPGFLRILIKKFCDRLRFLGNTVPVARRPKNSAPISSYCPISGSRRRLRGLIRRQQRSLAVLEEYIPEVSSPVHSSPSCPNARCCCAVPPRAAILVLSLSHQHYSISGLAACSPTSIDISANRWRVAPKPPEAHLNPRHFSSPSPKTPPPSGDEISSQDNVGFLE